MELWVGALNLGFLYAFMTMGVFITFRIHDFPDITVDGSFTSGAAATAVLIAAGFNPPAALLAGMLIGMAAGAVTAWIHARLDINGLLAGILVMTGLYSVNLHVMGRSNIPLLNQATLFTWMQKINPGMHAEIWISCVLCVILAVFWLGMSLFFRTDLGLSMRATGNNPVMAAANGVNVNRMKIFGIALANGFVGLSGGLVAQYQGFADIGMGIGSVVIGLASVIIGESILRKPSIHVKVIGVIIGSVVFRWMIAFALYVGMNPIDLKLLTAGFVLATLVISGAVGKPESAKMTWAERFKAAISHNRMMIAVGGIVILAISIPGIRALLTHRPDAGKIHRIGIVQIVDHSMLNVTRDAFLEEMNRIGYQSGKNCLFQVENANGDMSSVNTILDKFLADRMDVIVPISTGCTQAAMHKIKDQPIVFATVANPFIIDAGRSDTDHLPNVTGVYGSVPMDKVLEMVRQVRKGKIRIGSIWDAGQVNSVYNVEQLKQVVQQDADVVFVGATVTGSSEVFQAAQSLAQQQIDMFVLAPDNIVYSALDSVIKVSESKKIPMVITDVERLSDGALCALGYDYATSGIQAAHLVDRILKGESPGSIPFEKYSRLTIGVNLRAARQMGIAIPSELLDRTTVIIAEDGKVVQKKELIHKAVQAKRLALFQFGDNELMNQAAHGVLDELKVQGVMETYPLRIDRKNAQNEFYMAQSIAQEIVSQNYDYIVTLSTPALQVTAQVNKLIPHIFGAVTDPYRMGIAKTQQDHIPNITGVATFQPVEKTIQVMREIFPRARRIGIVWNPAEACSEACTYKARDEVGKQGFELVEVNVSSTSEVMDAVRSLLTRGVDLFLTSGDNTVNMAFNSVAALLRERRIPYFSNSFSDVERGGFIAVGADYEEVGRETARMAARVISGEDVGRIPINNYLPEKMYVNRMLAKEYGMELPEAFLNRAAKIR
jgi:putative ABC transport system permease protein